MHNLKPVIHNSLLIIGFLLTATTACMAEKPKQAWWLTLSIEPAHSQLDNVDVKLFSSDWAKAIFVDEVFLKANLTASQFAEFENSNFNNTLTLDLNKNSQPETVKVGVFKKQDGNKGVFLAIFENKKLLKVFTGSTKEGFSTLLKFNDTLRWYKCMNCGDFESIKWNGKSFVLE